MLTLRLIILLIFISCCLLHTFSRFWKVTCHFKEPQVIQKTLYVPQLPHPFVSDGHLGCFHVLAINTDLHFLFRWKKHLLQKIKKIVIAKNAVWNDTLKYLLIIYKQQEEEDVKIHSVQTILTVHPISESGKYFYWI